MELAGVGKCLKSLDIYLNDVGGEDQIVKRFDFDTIVYATKDFSESNLISSDSYKFVYKVFIITY